MSARPSDELVRAAGQLSIPVRDAPGGMGRPTHRDAPVADGDVGMVVGGLGEVGETVDEGDRGRKAVEGELPLERAAGLVPTFGDGHTGQYGLLARTRKPGPTRELVCDYVYRPLAHLVVLALAPLRTPPPAVVLAACCVGLAAAVEIARGHFLVAAALVVGKTVLDNADGQLARATGRVSAFGRYLDSESDLLVNAALFAALGYVTQRPLLALAAFVAVTLVLSANFNLRRLYQLERGLQSEALSQASGAAQALRRIYEAVYTPQDRAIEAFVRRRLRRVRSAEARLAYHDRATISLLHNLGLSGQMTALALCLGLARPELALWLALACGVLLVPLELRRGVRAARIERAVRPDTVAAHIY